MSNIFAENWAGKYDISATDQDSWGMQAGKWIKLAVFENVARVWIGSVDNRFVEFTTSIEKMVIDICYLTSTSSVIPS